jgi:two-component system, sensor histidine kinase LadS
MLRYYPIAIVYKVFQKLLLLLLFVCSISSAYAFPPAERSNPPATLLLLPPTQEVVYNADPYMEIYEDTSGTATFEDILNKQVPFIPKLNMIGDIKEGTPYWIKISIKNQLNWDAMFIMFPGKWDYVDLYQVAGGAVNIKKTGYLVPLEERDQPKRTPYFEIFTRLGEEQTLYLRAHNKLNTSRKSSYRSTIQYRTNYFENQIQERYIQGGYSGILLAMVLYNFIIFLMVRDRSYLYYVLSSACFFLYWLTSNDFTFEYLWTEYLYWDKISTFYLTLAFLAFYILFTKSFLNARQQLPRYNLIFNGMLILIGVGIGMCLAGIYIPFNYITPTLAIISTFIIVAASVSSIAKGNRAATYFLLANSAQLIGATVYGLMFMGVLPENIFTVHALPFGSVMQAILFSASLANRINLLNREVADIAIAKEKLQKEKEVESKHQIELRKQELEQQIKERTTELSQKSYELELKNKDIIDSIVYAKKIQEAISPDIQTLKEVLPKHFVLQKPKDIVSGDFYWFTTVKNQEDGTTSKENQTLIIAVADCIGHGVPGAFMSIIGSKLLDQIVNNNKVTTPSAILHLLHTELVKSLQQNNYNSSRTKEGMEIALLSIDFSTNTITFAGAKRPLYLVKDNALSEIRGNNFTIGGHSYGNIPVFQDHTFKLEEGTTLYLASDGYADQFGGENNKKFMSKNFKKKLISICHLEKEGQKEALEETFEEWKGSYSQVDDVLVVGIGF